MNTIELPEPQRSGDVSVEETMEQRRSVREYASTPLTLEEIGQLAWSAQGITDPARGFRTAPSAGATFPMEIYFLLTGTEDVPDGVYRYRNENHSLEPVIDGDLRHDLYQVALQQDAITNAPVVMVITGVLSRIEPRYRDRAMRYMYMEAGHVSQNVYLQSVPLDIGTVVIGAFSDDGVSDVLQLDDGEYPLYIMPIGKIR
ncbi:MAG: SagB/ThcOx family dehydrogenase [Balneolaceae bacterium]|nr:MAG: SagB/ThcOx family dehydrogenase [Balneolaceae bacterium]